MALGDNMADRTIIKSVGFAMACSVSFIAGYLFSDHFTSSRVSLAYEAEVRERYEGLFQSYITLGILRLEYDALQSVHSVNDVEKLRDERCKNLLRHARLLREQAESFDSLERREAFAPFLEEAEKLERDLKCH